MEDENDEIDKTDDDEINNEEVYVEKDDDDKISQDKINY